MVVVVVAVAVVGVVVFCLLWVFRDVQMSVDEVHEVVLSDLDSGACVEPNDQPFVVECGENMLEDGGDLGLGGKRERREISCGDLDRSKWMKTFSSF